ncbi:thioredoxin domain-containing protein [Candidatus Kaiserbacteria bacterium]|nr:thioredoxin domain-containing protein [Candidatus Kaiserbacteria bacterium]
MEEQQHSEITSSTPTKASRIDLKDLYIPVAIIVAGAFIGAGLFFGSPRAEGPAPTQANTNENILAKLVKEAGVSMDAVDACMQSGEMSAHVQADADNAVETGGRGTPWTIVIGPTGKTYPVNGAVPKAAFQQIIDLARSEADYNVPDDSINTDAVRPVTAEDHIKGSLDAPIKIVEYSDFDCPFCTRAHETLVEIMAENNDVAWVYRHFPLDSLHPNARTLATVSECVAKEGGNDAFWSFADGYFTR